MGWEREMHWMSPPKSAAWVDGDLRVVSGLQGDFWRGTYYGFHHHSGHFLHQTAASEFTAELRFSATFSALYDQAGLMIRADEAHWIKAGVEYVAGVHLRKIGPCAAGVGSMGPDIGVFGVVSGRAFASGGNIYEQLKSSSGGQAMGLQGASRSNGIRIRPKNWANSDVSELRLKHQVQHPRPAGHRMLLWTDDTNTSTVRNVA